MRSLLVVFTCVLLLSSLSTAMGGNIFHLFVVHALVNPTSDISEPAEMYAQAACLSSGPPWYNTAYQRVCGLGTDCTALQEIVAEKCP